ncbi:MAG TPA: aminoglycoside phosphotransferase family protein [Gaiellaceae bacterium]|nr:aminoglycoside phosphotransferase family protein [Gaiellaceae bacterium]
MSPEHEAWIRAHVEPSGPIEWPHEAPWSVVLRVPTRSGVIWFKENVAPLAYEAAVVQVLAERMPDRVAELVAVDTERGWILMRDAGTRLRELPDSKADWLAILPRYAELQLAVVPEVDRLLGGGTPDRRVATLPRLFRELVEEEATALGADDLHGLRELAHRLDEACPALSSIGVPESIQHDDFHDGNVFVDGGRYRFVDWGDCCVSHPFATLRIPFEGIVETTGWSLAELRDAYLEPFTGLATRSELLQAYDHAWLVAGVTRALKWAPLVDALPKPHRWTDAVPLRLRILLGES